VRAILTIGNIALKESLKGRIFYGMLIFLGLFLMFCVYISSLSLGTVARVIENTGMLGITISCLLVTILFGLYALYQEKERNELYVIINRLPRAHYLLGRFLGASYTVILFGILMGTGVFILTWAIGQKAAPELFLAVYMDILEFTLLIAFGILFYTLGLSFTLNAFLCLAVFVMGHSFDEAILSFIALGRFGSHWNKVMIEIASYLFPNFDMFNFRLDIVHGTPIPIKKIVYANTYWFTYLLAVLAGSAMVMDHKDL
jgi:Cu-processing system permease protein